MAITITFGGIALIGLGIAGTFMFRWLKRLEEAKKGKVNLKSITVHSSKLHDDDESHKIHKGHDDE